MQQQSLWASRGAAGPASTSSSIGSGLTGFAAGRRCSHRRWALPSDSPHARRFKQLRPEQFQLAQADAALTWPGSELNAGIPNSQVRQVAAVPEGWRPEQEWDPDGPPGSINARNPYAQRFRIRQLPLPAPFSLPGSDFWEVEILNNYKAELPSVRVTDNHVQLRLGLLGRVHDPPLTPFFYYRGIEHVQYTWTDRALQALYLAAYAALHMVIFGALATWSEGFAAAIALNWARQRLSLPKVALLLFLASSERVWLYFMWLGARLLDHGLKRLAKPVRTFFWANFTIWALYVLLSPAHYYPLPFAPFAPGTAGTWEAYT